MTDTDRSSALAVVRTYVELTKPRIIELLLITTVPAMAVAAGGWPGLGLVLVTLLGGTLSAGGANVINQVYDEDIDRVMRRTEGRPLPTERVGRRAATVFGVVLGVLGSLVLAIWATVLAGVLAAIAYAFYVFVYTMVLKRSSTQNIVIGGAAGAMPALIGWAAVTGDLSVGAWVMFGIIFYWTPPHFWALSLKYEADYRAAGIPMLSVVAGERSTLDQIQWYSVVTVGVSLLLVPSGSLGWIYGLAAVASGLGLVVYARRLAGDRSLAMRYFGFTNVYLAVVFLAMLIDRVVLDGSLSGHTVWFAGAALTMVVGLLGVVNVERRPEMRAPGVPAARHAVEVGISVAFGLGVLAATWTVIG